MHLPHYHSYTIKVMYWFYLEINGNTLYWMKRDSLLSFSCFPITVLLGGDLTILGGISQVMKQNVSGGIFFWGGGEMMKVKKESLFGRGTTLKKS